MGFTSTAHQIIKLPNNLHLKLADQTFFRYKLWQLPIKASAPSGRYHSTQTRMYQFFPILIQQSDKKTLQQQHQKNSSRKLQQTQPFFSLHLQSSVFRIVHKTRVTRLSYAHCTCNTHYSTKIKSKQCLNLLLVPILIQKSAGYSAMSDFYNLTPYSNLFSNQTCSSSLSFIKHSD
ncbi:unnamed protein product [Rhodiola kirilowii]